jgi:hypothetical protein
MLAASDQPIRKEWHVEFASLLLRRVTAAVLALLASFALVSAMLAQPVEAAPRSAVALVQDDDGGGDDDGRGEDDGRDDDGRGDDDDDDGGGRSAGGSSTGRGDDDDDDRGGVGEVPSGGIDTGAGGTASGTGGSALPGGVPAAVAGGTLVVAAMVALLRRVSGGAGA